MHPMVPSLYNSLLKEEAFGKASRSLDKLIARELRRYRFPIDPAVWTRRLSLSFPRQVGVAIYDIERSDDREFVGRVYGTEFRGAVGLRYGLLKIVLANSPLDVVLKGSEILEELELLASGASLGVVRQSEKDRTAYVIRSAAGERVVQLGSSDARLEHDGSVLRFGLQLDLARIPNFLAIFSRKAQANPNVVFEPRIPFPDAALMMALVLSVRMIYRRFDFNNT